MFAPVELLTRKKLVTLGRLQTVWEVAVLFVLLAQLAQRVAPATSTPVCLERIPLRGRLPAARAPQTSTAQAQRLRLLLLAQVAIILLETSLLVFPALLAAIVTGAPLMGHRSHARLGRLVRRPQRVVVVALPDFLAPTLPL